MTAARRDYIEERCRAYRAELDDDREGLVEPEAVFGQELVTASHVSTAQVASLVAWHGVADRRSLQEHKLEYYVAKRDAVASSLAMAARAESERTAQRIRRRLRHGEVHDRDFFSGAPADLVARYRAALAMEAQYLYWEALALVVVMVGWLAVASDPLAYLMPLNQAAMFLEMSRTEVLDLAEEGELWAVGVPGHAYMVSRRDVEEILR